MDLFRWFRPSQKLPPKPAPVPEPDDPWVQVAIVSQATGLPTGETVNMRQSLYDRIKALNINSSTGEPDGNTR